MHKSGTVMIIKENVSAVDATVESMVNLHVNTIPNVDFVSPHLGSGQGVVIYWKGCLDN